MASRYGLQPGTVVVIRPDQHVLTSLSFIDLAAIERSIAIASATAVHVHVQEQLS